MFAVARNGAPGSGYFDPDSVEVARWGPQSSDQLLWRCDDQHEITWVSDSVRAVLGWEPAELVGRNVRALLHPDDRDPDLRRARRLRLPAEADGSWEARFATCDGHWRRLVTTGYLVCDEQGVATSFEVLRDATADLRAGRDGPSNLDGLTGLADRPAALARIQRAADAAGSAGASALLACVGIIGLKEVNAALTHSAGDEVLRHVAERLIAAVGSRRVARVTGNEFAVLLPPVDAQRVGSLAARLGALAGGPVVLAGQPVEVGVSLGLVDVVAGDAAELLRDASIALHHAKEEGVGCWQYVERSAAAAARARIQMRARLAVALQTDQIRAHFQPIASLVDLQVRGYEALARWHVGEGPPLEPGAFMAVAESTDRLVVKLDLLILRQALAAAATLPEELFVSVNVSAKTLGEPSLPHQVRGALSAAAVDPCRLHLEVTETALLQATPAVQAAMAEVSDLGVRWWVDDFGTGFSSISHLRDLPIAGLKLDRSFTSGMAGGDAKCARLAQGLAGLASGLGLQTVAEGLETRQICSELGELGWELGQGWALGRPRPAPVPEQG